MSETEAQLRREMTPQFIKLLSDADVAAYNKLRSDLSSPNCRNRRNKRLETFGEMLNSIQSFAIRKDDDDWKRCLVCGVLWLTNGIAINTRQLRLLINKCKSSINGSLQKLGYTTSLGRTESAAAMVSVWPLLRENNAELRKWTVRKRDETHMYQDKLDSPPPRAHSTGPVFEISLEGIARPQSTKPPVLEIEEPFGDFEIADTSQTWAPNAFPDLAFEEESTFFFK